MTGKQSSIISALTLAMSVAPAAAKPTPTHAKQKPALVRLVPIPRLRITPRAPTSPAEARRIQGLVADLAAIDQPDFGLSSTLSGTAFAPVPGSERAGTLVLGNHGLRRPGALLELVKLGPRALPILLAHLDDRTPTHLTVRLEGILTWMQFSTEVDGNPANPRERKAFAALPPEGAGGNISGGGRRSHTVTVGDVCFVIIGQITGRGYESVRYQPTGGIVINSPTASPALAKAVRAVWSGGDPVQRLFDSLLLDYRTRGVHVGSSFDHWGIGERFQSGAAMRLLYYFPQESAPLIARRLRGLRVQSVGPGAGTPASDQQLALWMKRELANDVRTDDFIRAVAWCRQPEVKAALLSVFRSSDDPDLLLAALPAIDKTQWPLVRDRLLGVLWRQPAEEDGWYGDGYRLLVALRQAGGDAAKPIFAEYLRGAGVQRCCSVAEALKGTDGTWDREFLEPLLTDSRPSTYAHPATRQPDGPTVPIRVCDEAAAVVCLHRKELRFELVGSFAELDRQLRTLRDHLANSPAR